MVSISWINHGINMRCRTLLVYPDPEHLQLASFLFLLHFADLMKLPQTRKINKSIKDLFNILQNQCVIK